MNLYMKIAALKNEALVKANIPELINNANIFTKNKRD